MKVRALINYKDMELKKDIVVGDEYEVTKERSEVLLKGNESSGNKPFVEIVKENKKKEIEVETADKKVDKAETATVKKVSKKATK